MTYAAGVAVLDVTTSALFADYDNDGDQDLFLITSAGVLLFENDGRGRFRRARARFDVPAGEVGSMTMGAIADYDRDGFLDLYVCQYGPSGSAAMARSLHQPAPYFDANNGSPNHLFRNNGDGTFSEVTRKAGLNVNNNRWSFAASWADFDLDGWPDLYVANDFGRNNLYRNNGDGSFTDIAERAGVEDIGAGMSVAWGDYDNDGRPDLYVSNIWSAAGQRIMAEPRFHPAARRFANGNSLYRNRGGAFEETTATAGVANGGWAWSSDFIDADNDGREDLFIVSGHITNDRPEDLEAFHWMKVVGASPLQPVRSKAYEEGWREFQKRITESGESVHGGERNHFYRNLGGGRFADLSAASGLDLPADGRAFAILDFDNDGALDVIVKNRLAPQVRVLHNEAARGRSIAFELTGHGGNRDAIGAKITIEVPEGRRMKEVRCGSGFLSQHSRRVYFGLGDRDRADRVTVEWPNGTRQEFRDIPAGNIVRIEQGRGDLRVTPFSKPAKGPAADERVRPPSTEEGVWLLEPFPLPAGLLGGRSGPLVLPVTSQSSVLNAIVKSLRARRIAPEVPYSLLIDEQGRIVRIGGASTAAIPHTPAERLRAALPFPGTYYGALGSRVEGYFLAASECLRNNLNAEAEQLFRECLRVNPRLASAHSNLGTVLARRQRVGEALASFRTAATLDPGSAEIQFNLGTTLAMSGEFRGAVEALEKASAIDPNSAEIWANLGTAYLDSQSFARAHGALEQALRIEPSSAMAHSSLGILYTEERRYDLAERHLREAVRLQPESDGGYLNLGLLHLRQQRRDDANAMFRRALEINPANAEARRLIGKQP